MTWESNLRELLEKATPGPWHKDGVYHAGWIRDSSGVGVAHYCVCPSCTSKISREEAQAFVPLIVALRNDAEKLVTLVEAARAFTEAWERDDEHAMVVAGQNLRDASRALEGGTE